MTLAWLRVGLAVLQVAFALAFFVCALVLHRRRRQILRDLEREREKRP